MMKGFVSQQDESYTSAHIKAGRKIMAALMRLRQRRITLMNSTAGFLKMRLKQVGFAIPADLRHNNIPDNNSI